MAWDNLQENYMLQTRMFMFARLHAPILVTYKYEFNSSPLDNSVFSEFCSSTSSLRFAFPFVRYAHPLHFLVKFLFPCVGQRASSTSSFATSGRSAMSTERIILVRILLALVLLLLPDDVECVTTTETEFCEKYVRSKGYLCEEHKTQTEDGFVITLHRVGVKQSSSPSNSEVPGNQDLEVQDPANLKVSIGFSKRDVIMRSRNLANADSNENAWTSMDPNLHVDFLTRRPYERMVQPDASELGRPRPYESEPGSAYPHGRPRRSSSWPHGDAQDSPDNRPLFVPSFPLIIPPFPLIHRPPTTEQPAHPRAPVSTPVPMNPTAPGGIPTSAEAPVTLSSSVVVAPSAEVPASSQAPLTAISIGTPTLSTIDTPTDLAPALHATNSGLLLTPTESPTLAPYPAQMTISGAPQSSLTPINSNSKSDLAPSSSTQTPLTENRIFGSPAGLTTEPVTASPDPVTPIFVSPSPESKPVQLSPPAPNAIIPNPTVSTTLQSPTTSQDLATQSTFLSPDVSPSARLSIPPNAVILSPTASTSRQSPTTSQDLATQSTTFLSPDVSPSAQLSIPGLPGIAIPVGVSVPSPVTTQVALTPMSDNAEASISTNVGVPSPGHTTYMGNWRGSPIPSRGCEPVLLLHQELLNGDSWFKPADDEADGPPFPFILADEGFDVWIGHERATYWSHDHIDVGISNQTYWNWTWDEHAKYDVPSMLLYANSMTHSNVHLVGVSQSAAVGAAAATTPDVAALMRSLTLIGPTIYHGTAALPPMRAWVDVLARIVDGPDFGPVTGRFNLSREFNVRSISLGGSSAISGAISGPDCCIKSSVSLYDNGWDGTTSFKNFRHFEQGILTNTFKHFDYGSTARNFEAYGQPTPPSYSPRNIPAELPVLVIYGGQDFFSPPDGIVELLNVMKKRPLTKYLPSYAHFDLFFSSKRHRDVYHPIRKFLRGEYGLSSVPSAA